MGCNILYPLNALQLKALNRLKNLEWEPTFIQCMDSTWHNRNWSWSQVFKCCYNSNASNSNSRMEILTILSQKC